MAMALAVRFRPIADIEVNEVATDSLIGGNGVVGGKAAFEMLSDQDKDSPHWCVFVSGHFPVEHPKDRKQICGADSEHNQSVYRLKPGE